MVPEESSGRRGLGHETPAPPPSQPTLTAELLEPGTAFLGRLLGYLDAAKMVVLIAGAVLLLVLLGARLERHLIDREIEEVETWAEGLHAGLSAHEVDSGGEGPDGGRPA